MATTDPSYFPPPPPLTLPRFALPAAPLFLSLAPTLLTPQYDGYETFSLAPPPLDASYGASGSMDPPQPEDEDSGANANLVGGMVARLGLESGGVGGVGGGMALMEQLGLGEGTRVVDMQVSLSASAVWRGIGFYPCPSSVFWGTFVRSLETSLFRHGGSWSSGQ